jgi:HTH-type transcriptional regulator / antitoxin HigA
MTIKPIRTKSDYKKVMKRIDEIIVKHPKKGTAIYDELDVLGTLAAAYEEIHFPIDAPDPIEAVKYMMEENGLKRQDLVPYFGSKGLVSDFFNGNRTLSIRIIKSLHKKFGMPYEVLMG